VASKEAVRGEWRIIPRQPRGNLVADIDININNLMAIYVENGLMRLVNGKPWSGSIALEFPLLKSAIQDRAGKR
jgi:putative transposase